MLPMPCISKCSIAWSGLINIVVFRVFIFESRINFETHSSSRIFHVESELWKLMEGNPDILLSINKDMQNPKRLLSISVWFFVTESLLFVVITLQFRTSRLGLKSRYYLMDEKTKSCESWNAMVFEAEKRSEVLKFCIGSCKYLYKFGAWYFGLFVTETIAYSKQKAGNWMGSIFKRSTCNTCVSTLFFYEYLSFLEHMNN